MKSKTPRILIAISALVLVAGIVSIYLFSKTLRNDSTNIYITIGDYKFDKTLGRIDEYIGTENEIEIPSEIDGVAVSRIGGSAFSNIYNNSSIRSITIHDSVTNIESTAFLGCRSLEKITVNKDNICYSEVNGILFDKQQTTLVYYQTGRNAANYEIPDSVTSIGNSAFSKCTSLTSIDIPDSVTSIGDYAFKECSELSSITIPDSVTSISNSTFSSCSSLTDITIPDSVTSIECFAFDYCTSLTNITIPDSVTYIGCNAFLQTPWLEKQKETSSLVIVNGILIEADAEKCTGDVVIPDSVTSIGDLAFCNCSSLTSITIPNSVKDIGFSVFMECSSLKKITANYSLQDTEKYWKDGCNAIVEYVGT